MRNQSIFDVVYKTALVVICTVLCVSLYVRWYAFVVQAWSSHAYPYAYGVVLWASVYQDGRLSDVLQDRVDRAIVGYYAGEFTTFFVSGDDTQEHHEEVGSIVEYLIRMWIPSEDIVTDCVGIDTYDSLWRAKQFYWVDQAIVYSQHFHLSRAIYLWDVIGIEIRGVPVQRKPYKKQFYFELREVAAQLKAVYEHVVWATSEYAWMVDCVHR